jgi:hypothetical protein
MSSPNSNHHIMSAKPTGLFPKAIPSHYLMYFLHLYYRFDF